MRSYCVIGYPVSHSLSPQLHNRWFRKCHIDARYEAREVAPRELARFMAVFRQRCAGANVTIPHKMSIIKFLDALSPEASSIGAVNTIVNRSGRLVGYNTDVYGAMMALDIRGSRSKSVIVLGAGGAARAVVYGLKRAGAKVLILNRTFAAAKELAAEFGCECGRLQDFAEFPPGDVVINTTSVGMWPDVSQSPLPGGAFNANTERGRAKPPVVMDIIYRPRLTRFLRAARAQGCPIITGEKMFLAQAAKSFQLWTGIKVL